MPAYDSTQIVQIADVSLYMHISAVKSELEYDGKPIKLLNSDRVVLPYKPGLKARSLEIEGMAYATYGRSRSQMVNTIKSLRDGMIDIIACQFITGGDDSYGGNGYYPLIGTIAVWLHTMGTLKEVQIKDDDSNLEFKAELDIFSYWMPLNPSTWQMVRRQNANPSKYAKAVFESSDIRSLPTVQTFFQSDQPYSFHRRTYSDNSHHFDPTYFVALYAADDEDLRTRYATDWLEDLSLIHTVWVDKGIWTAPAYSLYLFKNLTSASSISIEVAHTRDVWYPKTQTTTIDVTGLTAALTAAGITLVDTDVLVLGSVDGGAYLRRNHINIYNAANTVSRDGGAWFGQLYPGMNAIKVRGGTFAQHHIFRSL